VIQEAMTNCVRHAGAAHIGIAVAADKGQLRVSVSDDGVGFNPADRHRGLGLRGIDERVRELDGTLTISRNSRGGTMLLVRLPLPVTLMEAPFARVAG
jgi:two-component system, NarL family, sensor kinase